MSTVTPAFRSILLALDFTEGSRAALRLACDLSARYGAALRLLHAQQMLMTFMPPDSMITASAEKMGRQAIAIDEQLDALKKEAEGLGAVRVTTAIAPGEPSQEILQAARDGGHDLIVMGTHVHAGLRHAVLGSVAERVVRDAPCPVLTVPIPR